MPVKVSLTGLVFLLLYLLCLLGGTVSLRVIHGSGKRYFALIDNKRYELPQYFMHAYKLSAVKLNDADIIKIPLESTFQAWREENYERSNEMLSSFGKSTYHSDLFHLNIL